MNVPKFIMEARAHDECDPDKTTTRKLALRYAGIIDDMTTTAIGRDITRDNAKEALRTLAMLGIRLGLEDVTIIAAMMAELPEKSPLVNGGYVSVKAALDSITGIPHLHYNLSLMGFKSVLASRGIEFESALSHFLLPE